MVYTGFVIMCWSKVSLEKHLEKTKMKNAKNEKITYTLT